MTDGDLAGIFDEWAVWERSRRLYAPSPNVQSIFASLVGPRGHDRPDAANDALMPYIHVAVAGSAEHGPIVIAYHYKRRHGTRDPVKRLAQNLGVSRQHFYRLLPTARQAIYSVATRLKATDAKGFAEWYRMAGMED